MNLGETTRKMHVLLFPLLLTEIPAPHTERPGRRRHLRAARGDSPLFQDRNLGETGFLHAPGPGDGRLWRGVIAIET